MKVFIKTNQEDKITLIHRQPQFLPTVILEEGYIMNEEEVERPTPPEGKIAVGYYTSETGVEWIFEDAPVIEEDT